MKIEIWSDVMCPFCYIGKRHLEKALNSLPFAKEIEIDWKSYQLNPDYNNTQKESVYDYLSRAKGMSVSQAKEMTGHVAGMASNVGLKLDFDTSIPANSFDAHRLIHLAKQKGLQDEAEEALFEAHFCRGEDVANAIILEQIGERIGLEKNELSELFTTRKYEDEVRSDIYESRQMGISGVPYFVFDRKYALSGAQPVETFKQALTQSFTEWSNAQQESGLKSLNDSNSPICDDNGCEI